MSSPDDFGWHRSASDPHFEENPVTGPVNSPAVPSKSTPEPVVKAAALWGTVSAFAITAIGMLVMVGVLSDAEAAAISSALDQISSNVVPIGASVMGVATLVSGIVSSLVSAFAGRRHVVPADSDAFDVVAKWTRS